MKEPVWELVAWERALFLNTPPPGGPGTGEYYVRLTSAGGELELEQCYTRAWSARRGGRRVHARYLKGTIRERSK